MFAKAQYFLDDNGAIARKSGQAKWLAKFARAAVAHATHPDVDTHYTLKCWKRKCTGEVIALEDEGDRIAWHCTQCDEAGFVSDWQNTLWDLRGLPAPEAAN